MLGLGLGSNIQKALKKTHKESRKVGPSRASLRCMELLLECHNRHGWILSQGVAIAASALLFILIAQR